MSKHNQIRIFIADENQVLVLAPKEEVEKSYVYIPAKIHLIEYGEKCIEKSDNEIPSEVFFNRYLYEKEIYCIDNFVALDWINQPHVFDDHIIFSLN